MNIVRVPRLAGAVLVAGMVTVSLTGCSLMELVTGGNKTQPTPAETTAIAEPTPSSSESTSPTKSEAPADSGTEVSVWDIKPGDCFSYSDTSASTIDKVTLFKSCDSKHQYEAFHAANMNGDKTFPGEYAVQDFAEKECGKKFEEWVNASGDFNYTYIGPSQESWEQGDDREVMCVAQPRFSKETTGSAKK